MILAMVSALLVLALATPPDLPDPQDQPALSAPASEPIDADRPHVGTGPHVVAPGQVQFELGGQWQHSEDVRSFSSPVLLRIGLADRVQGRVASAWLLIAEGPAAD